MYAVLIAVLALLLTASPAMAIVDGEADERRHPGVGMLAFEEAGQYNISCSGFYAGPYREDASISVFVTAGHCVNDFSTEQLRVTFEEYVEQSEEGFPLLPVSAASWHVAVGHASATDGDYGVVLLQGPVDGPAVRMPTARRLDQLADRGRLRPSTVFDNVGYGVGVKDGEFIFADRRMYSESKFLGLTKTTLQLLTNRDAGYGGVCYFDSGGPVLEHGTQNAVALISGRGDPNCRAKFDAPRIDIATARSFYRQYLQLP